MSGPFGQEENEPPEITIVFRQGSPLRVRMSAEECKRLADMFVASRTSTEGGVFVISKDGAEGLLALRFADVLYVA